MYAQVLLAGDVVEAICSPATGDGFNFASPAFTAAFSTKPDKANQRADGRGRPSAADDAGAAAKAAEAEPLRVGDRVLVQDEDDPEDWEASVDIGD